MNKKIKLVYIETFSQMGGGQIGLLDLLASINTDIAEPYIVVPEMEGAYIDALRKIPHLTIVVNRFNALPTFLRMREYLPVYMPFGVSRLKKTLRQIKPDLVHSNHVFAGKYGCPAARELHIPNLITVRNSYPDKPFRLDRFVDRRLYRNANYVVFNSQTGADIFVRRTAATNVRAIHNGIKFTKYRMSYDSTALFKQHAIPEDKKIFLVPARISWGKGQAVVIAALTRLKKYGDQIHIVFLGDEAGNDYKKTGIKDELKKIATQNGVDHFLTWVPFQDNVAPFYNRSHFTLLPSVSGEGLPRVIIESMVCGKPSIATKIAGIPELITNGENGYTCLPDSAESLADAMEKAINLSVDAYNAMCCTNKEIADTKFRFSIMTQKYEELYRSLLPAASMQGPLFLSD